MPFTRAVVEATTLPPGAAVYHITVPVAVTTRSLTLGYVAEQYVCDALPVGAPGVTFTVAVTSNLVVLSELFVVWDA